MNLNVEVLKLTQRVEALEKKFAEWEGELAKSEEVAVTKIEPQKRKTG